MAYTYTRTGTIFIAGEAAPDAEEALNVGTLVPNKFGNIALSGFRVDPRNRESEVKLDLTVEPPVLHLRNALTTTLFGYTDTETGQFVAHDNEMSAQHEVNGTYAGPDSELFIV